tara:strand:- start:7009 stop:7875 length:867 start_codon:yes stop_codon:yes gene_type:complete
MKRSVILMGGKTYVVSLPANWIRKFEIQKGQELDVAVVDNTVIVQTDKLSSGNDLEINVSPLDKMLRRVIGAAYKSGYDQVKITYNGKEQLAIIEEILQKTCIGFEVARQGDNFVIIRNLVKLDPDQFNHSFRRLFHTIETMLGDLCEATDKATLAKVIEKDEQVNRLADYCRRIINSGNLKGIEKLPVQYYIVEQLERMGDVIKKIAKNTKDTSLLEKMTSTKHFFEMFHKLYFEFSLERMEAFGKEFYSLRDQFKETKDYSQITAFQEVLLETIFDMNGAIFTMRL